MIAAAPNSYNRVTSQSFARLSDWQEAVKRSYPLRERRTVLPRIALPQQGASSEDDDDADDGAYAINNHRGMNVRSVIDVHAWDQARWRGCGYFHMELLQPPYMAFLFENAAAARKIFERWRARLGEDDTNEEIGISIIRELPDANVHHYCVQIASNVLQPRGTASRLPALVATRSMTMDVSSSRNLEMFLAAYGRLGSYYLIPAVGTSNPEFYFDLAIRKRRLSVKSSGEVTEHDIEALALRERGLKFAS
jgi:hypothetical protein